MVTGSGTPGGDKPAWLLLPPLRACCSTPLLLQHAEVLPPDATSATAQTLGYSSVGRGAGVPHIHVWAWVSFLGGELTIAC